MPVKCYGASGVILASKGTPGLQQQCEGWVLVLAACLSSIPEAFSILSDDLVPDRLVPELLPGVGGLLCWHHFQPLLVISPKAINLLQVGVFFFVL